MAFNLDTAMEPPSGPVAWKIPGKGEPLEISFTAIFKRLTQDAINAQLTDIRIAWEIEPETLTDAEKALKRKSNRELVLAVLAGWGDDLNDSKGSPVAFSDAKRDEVLNIQGAEVAFINAWVESITGARTKN
jgi:hypothetical protein